MIAPIAENQHAMDFDRRFNQLFSDLAKLARTKGIDRYCGYRGTSAAEDPEDFAQECLIEYSRTAEREKFRTVQTPLIKHIARNRIVDAWRKRDQMPKREDFEASTNQLTEHAGSTGDIVEIQAMPQLQCLSPKAIEILLLKHVAEFLDREIASVMNMTVNGVRSSLKRSRNMLLTKRVTRHIVIRES